MKILKNKKFWALTIGSALIGVSVIASVASCYGSNVQSKLSDKLVEDENNNYYVAYEITNYDKLKDSEKAQLEKISFATSITPVDKTKNSQVFNTKVNDGIIFNKQTKTFYIKLVRKPELGESIIILPSDSILKTHGFVVVNENLKFVKINKKGEVQTTPSKPAVEKKDNLLVKTVVFSKVVDAKSTLSFELSTLELADEAKVEISVELSTKKVDASDTKDVIAPTLAKAVLDKTTKKINVEISNLAQGQKYTVAKLTLNGKEIALSDEQKQVASSVTKEDNKENPTPLPPVPKANK